MDHESGWSRGTGNDVDSNSKTDSTHQGGNKMNSSGPNPSKKRSDIASVSDSNDGEQLAD